MATNKPDLTRVWASEAPPANVVDPDITVPGKVDSGWQAEVPPFEHFNYLQKWFSQGLAHNNEQGINTWDSNTTYPVGGLAKGSDGGIYEAITEQSGNDPISDDVNWHLFGAAKNVAQLRLITGRADGQQVELLGHTIAGIGGGTFYYDASDTTSADNNGTVIVTSGGERWKRKLDGFVSVEMFGAIADGITDSSDAVKSAVAFVTSQWTTPTIGSNRIITGGVKFAGADGGEYRITQPRVLIPNDLTIARTVGLSFFADNAGITIHFDFDGDDYLGYNNNEFLFVRFTRLTFTCNSDTAKFLFSTGNGGAQDYYYEDCKWEGVWQKLFVLRGVDNNSEWGFQKCSMTCSVRDVMMDIADSDQFLNYWFSMCKLWLYDGQCIRASKGGHFKFYMCDWSGLTPSMTLNTSVNGAPLFELLGDTHARGVCVLEVIGGRFEHKNELSKLIYCEWNHGYVSIDADTTSTLYTDQTLETVVFNSGNTQGPVVKFSGMHQGVHKYSSSGNGWNYNSRAMYTGVQTPHASINSLIKLDTPVNVGGVWNISCDQVESTALMANSKSQRVLDCDIGARTSKSNVSKVRTVTFRNAQGGGNPINGEEFSIEMPEQAVIVGVHWFNSGSLSSVNDVTYELRDGSAAVISSQSGTLSAGWDVRDNITHVLDNTKNTLSLVDTLANSNQQSVNVWCRVDYMYG